MTPPQPVTEGGYGDGLYSADDYGTPRATSSIQPIDKVPDAWSLDNFGQILLAMTSPDGRLLKWDPGGEGTGIPDAAATRVTSADTGTGFAPLGRLFVVTPERFVMIFGMAEDGTSGEGSFRRFGWCDQENPSSWNFSDVVSQAGYLDVEPSSPIVAAKATPLGVLFWTGTTTYISQFLGIPYVYNYQEIYKNSTPWSPSSVVTTTIMTLWFSKQGLFSYNGAWVAPMACKVRTWIDDDIDELNVREQACAVNVSPFNEFWWFFPQLGQPYNTRCVIYNYKEGWWSMGQMARSAGINGAYNAPTIMANGTLAYEHELGSMYSADADAAVGRDIRFEPDFGRAAGDDQADDPRHRRRREQPALFALLPLQPQRHAGSGHRRAHPGGREANDAEAGQHFERLPRPAHHRARLPHAHRARRAAGEPGDCRPAL